MKKITTLALAVTALLAAGCAGNSDITVPDAGYSGGAKWASDIPGEASTTRRIASSSSRASAALISSITPLLPKLKDDRALERRRGERLTVPRR